MGDITIMKEVSTDHEIVIDQDNEEMHIEIDYRCFITEYKVFYPMTVYASIYKGYSLQDAIAEGKEDYEKDYMKVEVCTIRIEN